MIRVSEIISDFPPLKYIGLEDAIINKIIQLDPGNEDPDILCWCNMKYMHKLKDLKKGTVIMPAKALSEATVPGCNYIIVENPRQYFNDVLTRFFWKQENESSVSGQSSLSASSTIGKNPFIGAHVVIKDNCVVGDNVRILNNTIIYPNTVIGDNVIIGANNVIGNYGFGYEKNNEGNYVLMPHIGNVVIESNVEIGNNNCIDRSVLGSTLIKEHTKIHNFVQVAHGVHVGRNCLVTANVTISGSTTIGDNVWLGPGVVVANKLNVGSFSYLSMGSVVLSDVPENATIIGNPGRVIKINKP